MSLMKAFILDLTECCILVLTECFIWATGIFHKGQHPAECVNVFRGDFTEDLGLYLDPEQRVGSWCRRKRRASSYCFYFSSHLNQEKFSMNWRREVGALILIVKLIWSCQMG